MSDQLEQQLLPQAALQQLQEGAAWLLSADFAQLGQENYDYCTDAKGLVSNFDKVLAHFKNDFPPNQTRITALRFEKSASIPVKQGSTVEVIPVHISDTARIHGEKLEIGKHIRLTEETQVEPTLYCLLLLAQG